MYTYINKFCSRNRVTLEEPLTIEYHQLGNTWEDYLKGKFVLLNDEQVAFMEKYPNATVYEIWRMTPPYVHERTLMDAKREMLERIEQFDSSDQVNGFTINHVIKAWFTVTERLNYKQSIEAAKLLGIDKLSFFVGDVALEVSPQMAEGMLAQLQLYADACFIVTKQHKIAVEQLNTIEEVDAYDYHVGYPMRPNFDIE